MRKILYILAKDVHNTPALKIYMEFIKKGYIVDLYAIYLDWMHINMFLGSGIKVCDFAELTEKKIEGYDYIFSCISVSQYEIFREIKKYIFIFSTTFIHEAYFTGDFTFTQRENFSLDQEEEWPISRVNSCKLAPSMAVGNPKFEGLKQMLPGPEKTILFIDSGHFPYGTKEELAKFVLKIAAQYSDYYIIVRPRYLKGDHNVTHRNDDYLYEHIIKLCDNNVPDNLELGKTHTNLGPDLERSKIVICMGTTTFFEAAVANRNILIIDNFPCEDSKEHNQKRRRRFSQIAKESECQVDYKDVFKYLPEGRKCSEKYLQKWIFQTEGVAATIVEAAEYIFETFINKGHFPKFKNTNSLNFKENLEADDYITWDQIIHRRYKNILYNFSNFDNWLNADIDFSSVLGNIEKLEAEGILFNKSNYKSIQKHIDNCMEELLLFNRNKLMKYAVDQSYLFNILFKRGRLSEIKETEVLCTAYYAFLKGKEAAKEGKDKQCIDDMNTYFKEVNKNKYDKTRADATDCKMTAFFYIGKAYYNLKQYKEAKYYFLKCEQISNNEHLKAAEYLKLLEEDKCGEEKII